jgi:hypothetical protein
VVASGRSCAAKCRCQGTRAARVVTSRVSTRALGRASNVRVSGPWPGSDVGRCRALYLATSGSISERCTRHGRWRGLMEER